jgi:hypothetical protein
MTSLGDRHHAQGDSGNPHYAHVQSLFDHQEAIRALFRVINRYVGNLPPMPGVFPDYPAPVVRNSGDERVGLDAVGHASATAHGRAASHQHPQHGVTALARMAQAREPMLGASQ